MTNDNVTNGTVIDVLSAHHSVRHFTDDPVSRETVERLVTAGTRASTSSNMQAYTVINVTDRELKTRLAALGGNQTQIHESAAFLVFCADLHRLTLACDLHGADAAAAGEPEGLLVAVVDVALVMQNVAVAAESLSLGICMIGAMRNHPHEVAEALGLPRHVMAIAGMCIGTPAEPGEVKPRLPLPAVLHENRYHEDAELMTFMQRYDEIQAAWYAERDMHVRDPRWTAVMSRRLPAFAKREAVGRFLADQGFGVA